MRIKVSLRSALTVPFIVLTLVMAGLFAFLAHHQQMSAADVLVRRILSLWSIGINQHLTEFLDAPFRVNRALEKEILERGLYSANDTQAIEKFLRSTTVHVVRDRDQITYVAFGAVNGDFIGMRRNPQGLAPFSLMLSDDRTHHTLTAYASEQIGPILTTIPDYDPRRRPWYRAGITSERPIWAPIYTNMDERQDLVLSAVQAIRNSEGATQGVLLTDINLSRLSEYLISLTGDSHGRIAIVDNEGCVVAHSLAIPITSDRPCGSTGTPRLAADDSPDMLLRTAWRQGRDMQTSPFTIDMPGDTLYGNIQSFTDKHGLHWHVILAVPESALLGDVQDQNQMALLIAVVTFIILVTLGLWLVHRLVSPIQDAVVAAHTIAQGAWTHRLPESSPVRETSNLLHAFNAMAHQLAESFSRMRDQVCRDGLTGLYSREGFAERFDETVAKIPPGQAMTLFRIGLDSFRTINDSIGPRSGDALLIATAARLKELLAGHENTVIARFGGDEFLVAFPDLSASEQAMTLAQTIVQAFSQPFDVAGDELVLSACIGMVQAPPAPDCRDEWLRQTGIAMSQAKKNGPGQIEVFVESMREALGDRVHLAGELSHALVERRLEIHFQPTVDIATGKMVGGEALARWNHPSRGWIPPSDFIPLAEETPLILDLGRFVMEAACTQAAKWLRQGILPQDGDIHVNVSPRQLIQSDFTQQVAHILAISGLPPHNLVLEVTESCLLPQGALGMETLNDLRALGVGLAIDDFGTGYSSLSYLHQVPLTCIKIDQSFTRRLPAHAGTVSIIAAVTHLASALGAQVVVEGVETEDQRSILAGLGCARGQGWLFGRPMPIDAFEAWSRATQASVA